MFKNAHTATLEYACMIVAQRSRIYLCGCLKRYPVFLLISKKYDFSFFLYFSGSVWIVFFFNFRFFFSRCFFFFFLLFVKWYIIFVLRCCCYDFHVMSLESPILYYWQWCYLRLIYIHILCSRGIHYWYRSRYMYGLFLLFMFTAHPARCAVTNTIVPPKQFVALVIFLLLISSLLLCLLLYLFT